MVLDPGGAAVRGEENSPPGGGGSREKDGFRVRYFLYFFLMLSKLPPFV